MTQKLKNDTKTGSGVTFESILGHFRGRSARVTFESLLGHFNSFCVSVELGARPIHKGNPLFGGQRCFSEACHRKAMIPKSCGLYLFRATWDHTPGWDFPEETRQKSGKTPETVSELFLEFPSKYGWEPTKNLSFGAVAVSRTFPEFSPPSLSGLKKRKRKEPPFF